MTEEEKIRKNLTDSFSEIEFEPVSHSYTIDNEKYLSVTSLVHTLSQPFDKEKVATAYALKHGMAKEDVISMWDKNSIEASSFGTRLHETIESCWQKPIDVPLRGLSESMRDKFIAAYEKYARLHVSLEKEYTPIVNEFKVYDKDYRVAGTVDAILRNRETGNLVLFDWKSSKEISKENKWQRLKKFFWLDDCNFVHYSFQLGIYRHILEKNCCLNISEMKIVQVSENYPEAIIHDIPYHSSEIEKLLKARIAK